MHTRALLILGLFALAPIAIAATSLQVVLPATSSTGVPFSFTVSARTGSAIDPGYLGTVHFTSSDLAATLPPDYTFTLADAGTHTFTATMGTAGEQCATRNQTITATDTSNSSITGTHATTVKWGPNVVCRLSVQAPETVQRTVPFPVVVSALNTDFQVVTSYAGTVHFEGSAGMSLPANYTFTAGDNGTRTFTMSASRGGDHLVTARDVTNPSIDGGDSFYSLCPELTAIAGNSGPVCAGSPVFLYGSSNQSDVTYLWSTGSGLTHWTSGEQNPIAPRPGSYRLDVTSPNGCSSFTTTTVEAVSVPSMTLSGPSHVCDSGVVTVSVSNPSPFADYVWSRSGETLPGSGPSVIVQVDSTTTISVRGKHVASGCNTGPSTFTVRADPSYPVVLTAPGSACPASTVTAIAQTGISESTINWSLTNAVITNDLGWTIEFVPTGSNPVTVTAIVNNQNGTCVTTDSALIPIEAFPQIVSQPENVVIRRGQTATLSVETNGTDLTFTWYEGHARDRSQPRATGPAPEFTTPPLDRTTSYWVEVASSCGSTVSSPVVVSVASKRRAAKH